MTQRQVLMHVKTNWMPPRHIRLKPLGWDHTPCPRPSLTCRWCLLGIQMEAVRQDSTRLQSENSQLHVLVLQHTERHERQAREHYQECKRLQDAIAELSYWKHQAAEKMQAAERENSGLRKRCDELVKLTDRLTTGTPLVPLSVLGPRGLNWGRATTPELPMRAFCMPFCRCSHASVSCLTHYYDRTRCWGLRYECVGQVSILPVDATSNGQVAAVACFLLKQISSRQCDAPTVRLTPMCFCLRNLCLHTASGWRCAAIIPHAAPPGVRGCLAGSKRKVCDALGHGAGITSRPSEQRTWYNCCGQAV